MNFSYRKLVLIFIFLPLTLGSCIKRSASTNPDPQSRWIRWASRTPLETRDWTECAAEGCLRHASLVMEGLTRLEAQDSEVTALPALASNVEVKSYSVLIEIRKGVSWSDGRELTAHHFLDSWKRVLSRCKSISASHLFFGIVGAETFCKTRKGFQKVGVEAINDHTLSIHLLKPVPFFARVLAHPVFWPRRLDSKEVLTLGAFIPEPLQPGIYRKNPAYYRSGLEIEGIQFIHSASAEEQIGLFREKSVDVVEDLPSALVARLGSDPNLIYAREGTRIYLLADPLQKPAHSTSVRKAFFTSLQKEQTVSLARSSLIPVGSLVREIPANPVLFDPASALTLLPQDLFPATLSRGLDHDPEGIAANLKAQWAKNLQQDIGLLPPRDSRAAFSLRRWKEDWFEPDLPPFIPNHPLVFSNAEETRKHWEKLQQQWVEEQSLILPLFEYARPLLKSPRLGPLVPNPVGGWAFSSIRIS